MDYKALYEQSQKDNTELREWVDRNQDEIDRLRLLIEAMADEVVCEEYDSDNEEHDHECEARGCKNNAPEHEWLCDKCR